MYLILRQRPSFRVIISSATIDASSFLSYFNAQQTTENPIASVVSVQGRVYPVDILYLEKSVADYVQEAIKTVIEIHLKQPPGDILVFLTGREEIDRCCEGLVEYLPNLPRNYPTMMPLPMHAGLSTEEQMYVFEPPDRAKGTRKVVVSTNVAKASVTIDGIVYVVDSGLVKQRLFNPHTSTDILTVVPCSLSSLTQRAGRAGRTRPGKCFRLFPESALSSLSKSTTPEICRSDLSSPVLALKNLGIDNVLRFDWLSPPPAQMLARALEFLFSLGAVGRDGRLSKPLGERMAEVPMEPMMAKVVSPSCYPAVATEPAFSYSIQTLLDVEKKF
ncbi:P-loop containing nucleoside triphosphate hydrolase protein [Atractiella rhizophila]|nr:P-loop containing nucleoside triphosphate hydrolase protein [Atractiella rhizophila]